MSSRPFNNIPYSFTVPSSAVIVDLRSSSPEDSSPIDLTSHSPPPPQHPPLITTTRSALPASNLPSAVTSHVRPVSAPSHIVVLSIPRQTEILQNLAGNNNPNIEARDRSSACGSTTTSRSGSTSTTSPEGPSPIDLTLHSLPPPQHPLPITTTCSALPASNSHVRPVSAPSHMVVLSIPRQAEILQNPAGYNNPNVETRGRSSACGSTTTSRSGSTSTTGAPATRPSRKTRADPKPTSAERPVKKRKESELQDFDDEEQRIYQALKKHLNESQEDHAYIVRYALMCARLDNDMIPPYEGKGIGGRPGIIYDDESPFKDMKPIANLPASATGKNVSQLSVFYSVGAGKMNGRTILRIPGIPMPIPEGLPPMPGHHWFSKLRRNITTEDDTIYRYIPYFGDNDGVEFVPPRGMYETDRSASTYENDEMGQIYCDFISIFLDEVNISMNELFEYLFSDIRQLWGHDGSAKASVLRRRDRYLPERDSEDAISADDEQIRIIKKRITPVTLQALQQAERVCKVFKVATGMSIWHAVKFASDQTWDSISETKRMIGFADRIPAKEEDTAKTTYSLNNYTALLCPICFIHECPFHDTKVNSRDDDDSSDSDTTSRRKVTRKSGVYVRTEQPINLPGWASASEGAAKAPWPESEPCSSECFITQGETDPATPWTDAMHELARSSAMVLKKNKRISCLLSSIINRPCSEIRYLLLQNDLIDENPSPPPSPPPLAPPPTTTTTTKIRNKTKEDDIITDHTQMPRFLSCLHDGPCTSATDCSCIKNKMHCEKNCPCPPNCPRRWRGCNCKRQGRPCSVMDLNAKTSRCACWRANRECDPDLCGSCGAQEALDGANRWITGEKAKERGWCGNVNLQKGVMKMTFEGRSVVAGMGLYVGEAVQKGEFIGEYVGELISGSESDRRGLVYDKRKVSYQFGLNKTQTVDSTYCGNKLRFINHSVKYPNCQSKILYVNRVHRIALFATRKLLPGEELFFNYGYSDGHKKTVTIEPPPPKALRLLGLGGNGNGGGNSGAGGGKRGAGAGKNAGPIAATTTTGRRMRGRARIVEESDDDEESSAAAAASSGATRRGRLSRVSKGLAELNLERVEGDDDDDDEAWEEGGRDEEEEEDDMDDMDGEEIYEDSTDEGMGEDEKEIYRKRLKILQKARAVRALNYEKRKKRLKEMEELGS